MIINEEVLILKEVNYKENDKILHALTRKSGKIQIISKGCRKNNSHLIHSSQLFAHSKCTLNKSKDMYIMTYAELINNFYDLKNNMDSFIYASYVLELISYVCDENEVDCNIFDMTVKVLNLLTSKKNDFKKLITFYELKLVSMLGYKPDCCNCICCGLRLSDNSIFSIEQGGFYCSSCANKVFFGKGINVNYNEIITLERILKTKLDDINSININDKITSLIRRFLFYYIGKDNFITLKLLC